MLNALATASARAFQFTANSHLRLFGRLISCNATDDGALLSGFRSDVSELCRHFPVPGVEGGVPIIVDHESVNQFIGE